VRIERHQEASTRPRFLLTFLAWAGGLAGGDRHLLEVASYWKKNVDVTVTAPPEAFATIRSFLGQVQMYPRGSAGARAASRGPLLALEYTRRALSAAIRPPDATDVVVAASHFSPDVAALSSLARRGSVTVAYVYHLVAARERNDPRTLWSKADERISLALLRRHADIVFVSNQATASALSQRGLTQVVRTDVGIDLASLVEVPRHRGSPDVLFVARMVESKGVHDVVDAWAQVRDAVPDARLVMAGDGPLREGAMRKAERLRVADSIEWPGFVSEDEKRRLLGKSSVFVAPSYEEGWGISVAEALATSLPVVGYGLPVLDELFPSAYLAVPGGDVKALAGAVVRVLNDQTLAHSLAERGLAAVKRFDVGRVADFELEQILSHGSFRRHGRA
jgi:glycosyltransferase involved in cell wall biosynthesis